MAPKIGTLIVGGGPAGIGVALGMQGGYLVVERQENWGGLSGTLEIDGAVFDLGGHSFHTPHPEVRELVFSALPMAEQKREARCLAFGELISYPFQKNFRQLSNSRIVEECATGLERVSASPGNNYHEFILNRFGRGIAEHFMLPYNRKLWGCDLRSLAVDWTEERVAAPEGVKEKFDTSGGKRKPLQADTFVAYPARGGYGEIFKALTKSISSVIFGRSIKRVDPKGRRVFTDRDESIDYETLVSTMPLNELLRTIEGVPQSLVEESSRLKYLSLKLVLVVIGHPVDTEIQRIYSAESHIAAHKTAVNHNSSDYLRCRPHHGIMAEVSYSEEKPLLRRDIERWVVENLKEMKLIKGFDQVRTTKVINAKYAYPVPSADRSVIVEKCKAWLERYSIHTVGRFGEWAYINSDEVLHRGLVLGGRLAKDTPSYREVV